MDGYACEKCRGILRGREKEATNGRDEVQVCGEEAVERREVKAPASPPRRSERGVVALAERLLYSRDRCCSPRAGRQGSACSITN